MKRNAFSNEAYVCRVDGGAIVLDCATDKYYSVDPRYLAPLLSPETKLQRDTDQLTDRLGDKPFSCKVDCSGQSARELPWARLKPCCIDTMTLTTLPRYNPRTPSIRLEHGLAFCRSVLHVTMNLRHSGLARIVDRFRKTKAADQRNMNATIEPLPALVEVFRAIRPWMYTARDRCLFDSLVLTDFLLSFHQMPLFVIGVRTKPFAAHAWVQDGDSVIDDYAENVQGYTPILAV